MGEAATPRHPLRLLSLRSSIIIDDESMSRNVCFLTLDYTSKGKEFMKEGK